MRSHTGEFIIMGTGGAYVESNKKITLRAQLRPILSEYRISWHRWSVPEISWKRRDTRSTTVLYNRIIKVPSNWIIIAYNKVASGLATSLSDIILSLIASLISNHLWNSVPLWTWSGITSRKHYRDLHFVF